MSASDAGLRLLLLYPFPPRLDADHGGARVTGQLLSRLADRYRVSALYLRGPGEPPMQAELSSRCEQVAEIHRPTVRWSQAKFGIDRSPLLAGLVHGKPRWVLEWWVADFARRAAEIARDWKPDVVQAEFHLMGQYLTRLPGCPAPRVLVEHDPGSATAAERQVAGIQRLKQRMEVATWRRYEKSLYRQVQAVVVFTRRDQGAVAPLVGSTPVVRIPLGTELPGDNGDQQPANQTNPAVLDGKYLLFAGNFSHPPNVDAALRATREIYPLLQARYPDLRLFLVGVNPPEELRRVASEHIIVTGEVPAVTPYLEAAAVVLAPIRQGGGMRVKVLEALAAGKPLVATPLAVEGLGVTDGRQVLLAESSQELAEKVACLLDDEEQRRQLSAEAAAWARQNLGWEASVDQYQALYRRLLEAQAS